MSTGPGQERPGRAAQGGRLRRKSLLGAGMGGADNGSDGLSGEARLHERRLVNQGHAGPPWSQHTHPRPRLQGSRQGFRRPHGSGLGRRRQRRQSRSACGSPGAGTAPNQPPAVPDHKQMCCWWFSAFLRSDAVTRQPVRLSHVTGVFPGTSGDNPVLERRGWRCRPSPNH